MDQGWRGEEDGVAGVGDRDRGGDSGTVDGSSSSKAGDATLRTWSRSSERRGVALEGVPIPPQTHTCIYCLYSLLKYCCVAACGHRIVSVRVVQGRKSWDQRAVIK